MAEKQEQIEETARASANPEQDEELSALLNSALDDFGKPPPNKAVEKAEDKTSSSNTNQNELSTEGVVDAQWTDEFIKQTAAHFEHSMQAILSQGGNETITSDQLGANFQRFAEVAAKAMTEEGGTENEFTAAISQTLKSLSEGAENLQVEEDIENMFSNMNMEGNSEGGEFLPFMQQMMQSLLSKEILYPALKDIVDKYPAWLEENKSKLEPSEFDRFSKQKQLMDQVCVELEKESEVDTPEIKKQRFDVILDLMQKMQDCGQPPKDLVGDLGPVVTFDEQGNPQLPGLTPGSDLSQCSVM
ncbi:hypothetical protein L9F63_013091 [Diploptera punctata]|uniref:Peroxin-19 n=1 Tax=Diploptera punctata TaxID=6984 RepID=A0AAD8AB02_DIPPU|nr:hypothetical protein L9F63_013091 [Diploptera punctata]